MKRDKITQNQAIFLMVLYLYGNTTIFGGNIIAGRDSWIAFLIATAAAVPIVWVYSRIISLHPEEEFFDILEIVCGKTVGTVFTVLLLVFAIYLGGSVLRGMAEFINVTSLPDPPWMPFRVALMAIVIYLLKGGEKTLGRWGTVVLVILVPLVLLLVLGTFQLMDFQNLLPMLDDNWDKIAHSAYDSLHLPLLEIVMFLAIMPKVSDCQKPFKPYLLGLLFGAALVLYMNLRNLMLLGEYVFQLSYFPSYTATKVLHIGKFITRLEESTLILTLLSNITKLAIIGYFITKAIAKLVGTKQARELSAPACMLILTTGNIVFHNLMEQSIQLREYSMYSWIFQIAIPVIIWISAEVRGRVRPKKLVEQPD